jgi:hypothetical protein
MALPRNLEDWLTEVGDHVVNKMATPGAEALSPRERLIYEVWVFDTETRNGGVSQYFGNRGIEQWESLRAACRGHAMPHLKQFMEEVDRVIRGAADPYAAVLKLTSPLEEHYWSSYQGKIVAELRRVVSSDG